MSKRKDLELLTGNVVCKKDADSVLKKAGVKKSDNKKAFPLKITLIAAAGVILVVTAVLSISLFFFAPVHIADKGTDNDIGKDSVSDGGDDSGEHVHVYDKNNVCTVCGQSLDYTEGLTFETIKSPDHGGQTVLRLAGVEDKTATDIIVPAYHNDLPVTEIGEQAFKDNDVIKSVTIPDGVKTISKNAFYDCNGLSTVKLGKGVSVIGDGAFYGCSNLIDIVFPKIIEYIGENCFGACERLESVEIEGGAGTVGAYAFAYCKNLFSAILGDLTESISDFAFAYDGQLKTVSFGGSLKACGDNVFYQSEKVNTVYFFGTIADWCGLDFNYKSEKNGILYRVNKLYIDGKPVEDLIIPSDVEKVGDYAFSGYRALKSVTIEKGVKSVGRSAFYACSNLKTADLGKEISDIGTEAFGACEGLRKVVIGDGLEYIREYTFSSLLFDEIVIGKDVKVIAENAFSAGANVKNLYFDGDLKDWLNITIENNNGNFLINTENFYVNGSLVENVVIPAEITTVSNNLGYCKNLKTVVIEDGAQKLGDYAFWKCENLESVVIPETVTEIGAYAFSGCKNLGGISLPSTLTKISEGLLSDCAAIENVAIPTTATIIEKQAFANMMSLKEIVVPNAVTKIGDDAFHSCTSLASVSLSENLTRIGEGSFYNCNSLFEITLPDGLESIGYQAFYCCRNIRKIVIPDSVTTVGTYAFSGMTKLNGVTVGKNVAVLCSFDSEAIIEVYNRSSLDVTEEVQTSWGMQKKYGTLGYAKHVYTEGESYLRAEGDYTFYDDGKDVFLVDYKGSEKEVILPSGYKGRNYTVHDYAFYYDLDLVSVTIPDGVTAINGAFRDCENLERAYIGDTVQTIGIGCFYGCKKLSFVSAGGGLKEIGLSAFAECENLTELEFSDGLEVIKSFAFEKCVGLISLILPTSVKSVGSYALSQVSRYIDVYYKGGVSDFEKVDADEYFDWSAHIRYYSETQPSTDTTLIFWHYDEDGKIVFW